MTYDEATDWLKSVRGGSTLVDDVGQRPVVSVSVDLRGTLLSRSVPFDAELVGDALDEARRRAFAQACTLLRAFLQQPLYVP